MSYQRLIVEMLVFEIFQACSSSHDRLRDHPLLLLREVALRHHVGNHAERLGHALTAHCRRLEVHQWNCLRVAPLRGLRRGDCAIREISLVAHHEDQSILVELHQIHSRLFEQFESIFLGDVEDNNVGVHKVVALLVRGHVAHFPKCQLALIAIIQIDNIGNVIPINIESSFSSLI